MSFYRLWAGKVVEEEPSTYFEADVEYIKNVSDDIGASTKNLSELQQESMQSFRGDKVSEEAEKLIATIYKVENNVDKYAL